MLVAPCALPVIDIPPNDIEPWVALIDESPLLMLAPPPLMLIPPMICGEVSTPRAGCDQYGLGAMSSRCSVFSLRAGAWRPALVVTLIAAVALPLIGAPLQGGALVLLPALALVIVMLTRPYLGEGAIARLRLRRGHRPRSTALSFPARRSPARAVRGGRLLAVALAGRAPPLALASCR
jgi:hypothetical protein